MLNPDSVVYTLGDNLYINLTNRCPCNCSFCLRYNGDTVGTSASLWLESEPDATQVISLLSAHDVSAYKEVVFCGYGEPTCALEVLLDVARWLKARGAQVRLDTNGLADLIWRQPVAPQLHGLVDTVSVSLNAADAAHYNELCRPVFGEAAFEALQEFAVDCRQQVPQVMFSVVDVIGADEIERCRAIAERCGVGFRVRPDIKEAS